MKRQRLFEGLRSGDLRGFVETTFSIDRFTSKMGEDSDVIVLGFKVNDKLPAIDLMEFIEKGYDFVLDSDMSSGEESDGKYHVFVEIQRSKSLPRELSELLNGVSRLIDSKEWRFKYHKDSKSRDFNEQSIYETVPLTKEAYENKLLESKNRALEKFFDKTPFESIALQEGNILTIAKPYSGYIDMEILAMGSYNTIKKSIAGGIQLDEASQSQVNFLEKYLGPYEIHKINGKFLIRNGDQALIVKKERW